jgi:hypothetical protein
LSHSPSTLVCILVLRKGLDMFVLLKLKNLLPLPPE